MGCWGGVCICLDSERAGSGTLEKSSRRDRDRDCAKFESSRRFRGSNMNPKKKSRRCRGLGLDSGLDLAISRFIYSFACKGWTLEKFEERHRRKAGQNQKFFCRCNRIFMFIFYSTRQPIKKPTALLVKVLIYFNRSSLFIS